ncbi:MAG: hypothetical protein E7435_03705 [Ruminococcaceae bacterium]|nr:hypothetical protein [Oscillospiraceae bacterium]
MLNRRSLFLRMIAITLVLSITGAFLPVGVLAASAKDDKTVVVSMGDSMTNGYGNKGYDDGSGILDYANSAFSNQFSAYLAGYTGEIVNDQVIFEGDNGVVDHRQLAMSGMRAVDLYWLLTLDYKNSDLIQQVPIAEWNEETWYRLFDSGDYQTYSDLLSPNGSGRLYTGVDKILSTYGEGGPGYGYYTPTYTDSFLQTAAEYYQKSVKDADVILMSLGNSDFGSFMMWSIADYMMQGEKLTDNFDVSRVYAQMPAHIKDVIDLALGQFDIGGMLGGIAGDNPEAAAELSSIITYCVVNYLFNYMRVLDAILELNPDVQIVQIGMVNSYASEDGIENGTLGEITGMLYGIFNTIVEVLPKVLPLAGLNSGWRANFSYVDPGYVERLAKIFGDDFYMDANGNFVKYPGSLKGDEGYTANENSVIRRRLFEGIFQGQAFDILQDGGLVKEEARSAVTYEEMIAYDLMTTAEKIDYAVENLDKATSLALYLAMEKAHVEGGKAKILMSALGALGGLNIDLFEGAINKRDTEGVEKGKTYLDAVVAAVVKDDMKDNEDVLSVTERLGHSSLEDILSCTEEAHTADCGEIKSDYENVVSNIKKAVNGEETVEEDNASLKDVVDSLCLLIATPEVFGKAIAEDEILLGVMALNANCIIGTGVGSHPSDEGHDAMFAKLKSSYEAYEGKGWFVNLLLSIGEWFVEGIWKVLDWLNIYTYSKRVGLWIYGIMK